MGTSVDRALELPKVGWGEGTGCLFAHPPYCLAEGCWGGARCCPGWLWHRCQRWQLKGSGGPAAWACPGGVAGAPTASAELTDPRPGGLAGPLGRGSCQALFPQLPSLHAREAATPSPASLGRPSPSGTMCQVPQRKGGLSDPSRHSLERKGPGASVLAVCRTLAAHFRACPRQ